MTTRPTTRLAIFDCDGVLIDSEPIANRVLAERLRLAGLALSTEEVMRRFVGKTRQGCLDLAGEIRGSPLPDDFGAAWDAALFEALREVRPVPGIEAVLDAIPVPWCVASNGQPDRMRHSLAAAGLLPRVGDRLFTASEVARPKPAPDLFLHAARRMGFEPGDCIVVEDTPTGAAAGVAAGMRVFGYAGAPHADIEGLRLTGAMVFNDMRQLPQLAWARSEGATDVGHR